MSQVNNEGIKIQTVQLVISVLIVLGAIFTTWMNVNSRIAILETKQQQNEDFKLEIRESFKEISNGQTKILIELQNKKDKPN